MLPPIKCLDRIALSREDIHTPPSSTIPALACPMMTPKPQLNSDSTSLGRPNCA